MMSDAQIEELTTAAETLYQYCDAKKGFYGGKRTLASGKIIDEWNSFSGCKTELEERLGRRLNQAEVTILSLAVGFGPTPKLSQPMRESAMETLWSRRTETRREGCFRPMMDVLVSFY